MLKLKAKLFRSTMAIKPFVDVDPERQLQWHFPILSYLKKLPPLCIKSYFLFYFSQLGYSFNRIVVKDRQFLSLRFLFLIKKFPIPQKLEQKIWISSTLNDFFPQKTSCSLQWRVEFFWNNKVFFPVTEERRLSNNDNKKGFVQILMNIGRLGHQRQKTKRTFSLSLATFLIRLSFVALKSSLRAIVELHNRKILDISWTIEVE